jgi:HSP20 family protein
MKLAKHSKEKSGALAPVSRAWTPFGPLKRLQEDIDRLFEAPFGGWLAPAREMLEAWGPVVDVYEDKNNVVVKVEIPGMKKEEIEVYMDAGLLNIAGERKEEIEHKGAERHRSERYFGRFHRSFSLPTLVEAKKIEAHYKDGVLTVTCPKTEEAKRKEVEIKVE